ncbi:MAG: hypothetical protein WC349_00950 [Patescibacteria group bacterium]|jgi:hypothetical protein
MFWNFLLPFNKYVYIGFALIMLGVITLPVFVGLLIMPVGIVMFVFSIHKSLFDAGKKYYSYYQKIREMFKK